MFHGSVCELKSALPHKHWYLEQNRSLQVCAMLVKVPTTEEHMKERERRNAERGYQHTLGWQTRSGSRRGTSVLLDIAVEHQWVVEAHLLVGALRLVLCVGKGGVEHR
jgi:hypothetical protein